MKKRQWKQLESLHVKLICPYCLKPITNRTHATVEHEPPKSRRNELGNSKTYIVCARCNHEKGALTLSEYKEWKRLEAIRHGKSR